MDTYFSLNAESLLKKRNLTQKDFCEKLGKSKSSWANIVKTKNIELLFKISEILNMKLDDLIGIEQDVLKIHGFVQLNEEIKEVASKDDLLNIITEVEKIEKLVFSKKNQSSIQK